MRSVQLGFRHSLFASVCVNVPYIVWVEIGKPDVGEHLLNVANVVALTGVGERRKATYP